MKFTRMIHISFAIMRLFCHKLSAIFKTVLPKLSETLYTNVKFSASTSEHITSGTRKLQSNCDSASVQFVLTETWKTSFSFTTMPGLTPACAHVRQSPKRDGLFFPILLTAQIWHPKTTNCLVL
jgi:hypothetical protein